MGEPLDALWDLRKSIWRNGMRPLCIRTSPQLLKFPTNSEWSIQARLDPPYPAVCLPPDPCFQGTGILADGLQPIDIDLRDVAASQASTDYCLTNLGPAPTRFRANSPRKLLLYRAAEGSPPKAKAWEKGVDGQQGQGVEVLGHGNQFHAYGYHPSGTQLEWQDDRGPHNTHIDQLTQVSTEQIDELLRWAMRWLNPELAVTRRSAIRAFDGPMATPSYSGNCQRWLDSDIQAALDAIPNLARDYDWWFTIMCGVYVASHGEGFDLFRDWSSQNLAHQNGLCRYTWNALTRNPPTVITGHTLIRNAREANGGSWIKPSRRLAVILNPFD